MIALRDIMSVQPVRFTGLRLEDGKERVFKMGMLMDKVKSKGTNTTLLTTFDAIHSGVLTNIRVYPGHRVRGSMHHWLNPYPKPVYDRHTPLIQQPGDPDPTVYGRIRKTQFVQLMDDAEFNNDWKNPKPNGHPGSGMGLVQAGITDPDAIEQLLDGRFLTVSQGSNTDHLFCSACGLDWVKQRGKCEHQPGHVYELQDSLKVLAYLITGDMFFDHLARANRPAQPYSTMLACEFLDQKVIDEWFTNGELIDRRLQSAVLIDSQSGATQILFDHVAPTPSVTRETEGWTNEDWAEVYVLTALADAGRLKDSAIDEALPKIKAFRASDRKPVFGAPTSRIGPQGCIPVCDAATAKAALQLAEMVKGADVGRLREAAARCLDNHVPVPLSGGSTMPNPSAKTEWADIVKLSDEILQKDEASCFDWSSYQGDLFELAIVDGEGEAQGAACGIITADTKLTTKARKALKDSDFCGPNRTFPAHDKAHVRNALARLPQASNFSSSDKAKILACVRRRAKALGVEVNADALEYDAVMALHDSKPKVDPAAPPPEPPPANETLEAKAHRLEQQNRAFTAKVEDLQTQNSRLIDELQDVRGELHKHLAQQVFDMRLLLKKRDVVVLDSEEKKQEYVSQLRLRQTSSLRDSLVDLSAEIDSTGAGAPPEPPPAKTDDPTTATLQDNLLAARDKGKKEKDGDGKAAAPPTGNSQLDRLTAGLRGS